jgi:hypothetical protein
LDANLNTIFVHAIDFVFSTITIVILIYILYQSRNSYKSIFATQMIILPLVSMIHIATYSCVLFIDHLDGVVNYPLAINYWTLFVVMQFIMTMFWITMLAYLKYRRGELFK